MFLATLDKDISKSYLTVSRRDVCKNDYWLITNPKKVKLRTDKRFIFQNSNLELLIIF